MTLRKLYQRFKNYPPGILLSDFRDFLLQAPREMGNPERRIRHCKPGGRPIGKVLLCYSTGAFFLKRGAPIPNDHTNRWESLQIAKTFLKLGYSVDVINENNLDFVPTHNYTIFVGNRTNFERIARLLNEDCVKILHIDTSHWLFHNMAEYRRLEAVQERRGIVLPAQRTMLPNLSIEHADYGVVLGNEATISTYRYAKKPLYRVPISAPSVYAWQDGKDFTAVRKNFLWFGSHGFVHKGLDLVLEAFADMPDYHLTVCGPLNSDKPFQRAYQTELYETNNIHTVGWVDAAGPEFVAIARNCIGTVFASCSEGGGGGVVTCMHAGLIPIVTHEASVDVDPSHGVMLKTCAIEEIRAAVRNLSRLPSQRLSEMARKNWKLARARHTRDTFAETYSRVISEIMASHANGKRVPSACRKADLALTSAVLTPAEPTKSKVI